MMVRRPDWLSRRRGRRYMIEDYMEEPDYQPQARQTYKDWLLRHGGRPMHRAIRKAEDRYAALKPARIRASRLHEDYRAKR